jgi:hypothetical protein
MVHGCGDIEMRDDTGLVSKYMNTKASSARKRKQAKSLI